MTHNPTGGFVQLVALSTLLPIYHLSNLEKVHISAKYRCPLYTFLD
jgi:hypothetical protein